jgi:hypothetical protein
MKFKIKSAELAEAVAGKSYDFPKYTTQIINLANQNAQGTRPKVVGQLSELIEEFPGITYNEWVKWYQQIMPNVMEDATEKIYNMLLGLKDAFDQIDKNMVRMWVRDLILTKTFIGLKFQKTILLKVAEKKGLLFRKSTPQEESQGIDGYIGKRPVSIKPISYKTKNMLNETIDIDFIFYEKKKDGIQVEYNF